MSQVSSTSGSEYRSATLPSFFDTYLCTEPAGDVPLLIRNGPDEYTASMRTLQRSADYFAERDQIRAVERLQWEMAKVHIQHEQWDRAVRVLTPLWQTLSWRKAGWWQLLEEVDWALRDCASRIRSLETLIAVEWELFSNSLTSRQNQSHDFSAILKSLKPLESRPRTIVKAENTVSCICATFAFNASEGNVGVSLPSQVLISSRAHMSSHPLAISQVKVAFGGNLRDLIIQHEPSPGLHASSAQGPVQLYEVPLQKASPKAELTPTSPVTSKVSHLANDLVGSADLRVAPGTTKVFSFAQIPRDAGDVEVASLTLCLNEDDFDLEVLISEDEQVHQDVFWSPSATGPKKKTLKPGRSSVVKILPKPPKMRIEIRNLASTYFTDEVIALDLWVMNEEDEEADVTVEARVMGSKGPLPAMLWKSDHEDRELVTDATYNLLEQSEGTFVSKAIGNLAASTDQNHGILIQALSDATDYTLEVRARYYLLSDPETPISKFSSTKISVNVAFEVSYSFTPMIDSDPWPSYFNLDELHDAAEDDADQSEDQASGLKQKWHLTSRLYSLASEPLSIDSVDLQVLEIQEAAICKIDKEDTSKQTLIAPNDLQERGFILKAQKTDLEDRRPTSLDMRMGVLWHREGHWGRPTATYLAVPELVIPFGEPRVLAIARNSEEPLGVIHLDYVIENPSTYALTFNVAMDSSEEFAFSGPKNVSVELLPLSRHTIRYNLLPMVKGAWISPQLRVFDTHFQKALKANATGGMRSDKKGLSVWVDADG